MQLRWLCECVTLFDVFGVEPGAFVEVSAVLVQSAGCMRMTKCGACRGELWLPSDCCW